MPDFLHIGAPRAASTWLHHNLSEHPEIWVPPCKGILYFHPRFAIYRLKMVKRYGRQVLNSDWYRRFLLTPFVTRQWYEGLFPLGKITGEIAEAYCSLENKDVERIHETNPKMKIIFVMRNPYERALSHARLACKRKGLRGIEAEKEMKKHLDHPSSKMRSSYMRCLEIWEKYFPAGQFFIWFYEDVQQEPMIFLKEICAFLGAEFKEQYFEKTVFQNINKSGGEDVSPALRDYAARKYYAETKALSERFGGRASEWLRDLDGMMKVA